MLAGLAGDARSAFEFFASKRSKITKGVTQASQKRYVAYFEDICRKRKAPKVRHTRTKRVSVSRLTPYAAEAFYSATDRNLTGAPIRQEATRVRPPPPQSAQRAL